MVQACMEVCERVEKELQNYFEQQTQQKFTNPNALAIELFLIWTTCSLSMAWWLFGTMLQAPGFPVVFELDRDGPVYTEWPIIIVFRIIILLS